mmetsp:Transcript_20417/g.30282  ORF Transcript_20417/g.30282 Transcript_20417/m.30282 type:complete len:108 (+) Transcript_20417:275-598(+)
MSMKKLLGLCTRRLSLWVLASWSAVGCKRSTGILGDVWGRLNLNRICDERARRMVKSRGEKLMLLKNNNWRNIDGLLAAAAATEHRKSQRQLESSVTNMPIVHAIAA